MEEETKFLEIGNEIIDKLRILAGDESGQELEELSRKVVLVTDGSQEASQLICEATACAIMDLLQAKAEHGPINISDTVHQIYGIVLGSTKLVMGAFQVGGVIEITKFAKEQDSETGEHNIN
jgi:hypothetical protein